MCVREIENGGPKSPLDPGKEANFKENGVLGLFSSKLLNENF